MIPTEKAVIRKIFVCYVYNLLVYVLTAYGCTLQCTKDIIILWILKCGITMLVLKKDDIEFVTEFPCLLGHPVLRQF